MIPENRGSDRGVGLYPGARFQTLKPSVVVRKCQPRALTSDNVYTGTWMQNDIDVKLTCSNCEIKLYFYVSLFIILLSNDFYPDISKDMLQNTYGHYNDITKISIDKQAVTQEIIPPWQKNTMWCGLVITTKLALLFD